jgi:hypothetical protein
MTPAQHLKAAQQARLAAHAHDVAERLQPAPRRCDCHGGACDDCRQIEGLTDGLVHLIPVHTPGDDAITN